MTTPLDRNNQISNTSINTTQPAAPAGRQSFRSQVIGILNRIGTFFGRGDTAGRAGTAGAAVLTQPRQQVMSMLSSVTTSIEENKTVKPHVFNETVAGNNGQETVVAEKPPTHELSTLADILITSNDKNDFKQAYVKLGETLGGLPPLSSETPTTGVLRTKLGALKKENPELYAQVIASAGQMRSLEGLGLDSKEKAQIEKVAQAIVQFAQPTRSI